jgi:hypothetical protein
MADALENAGCRLDRKHAETIGKSVAGFAEVETPGFKEIDEAVVSAVHVGAGMISLIDDEKGWRGRSDFSVSTKLGSRASKSLRAKLPPTFARTCRGIPCVGEVAKDDIMLRIPVANRVLATESNLNSDDRRTIRERIIAGDEMVATLFATRAVPCIRESAKLTPKEKVFDVGKDVMILGEVRAMDGFPKRIYTEEDPVEYRVSTISHHVSPIATLQTRSLLDEGLTKHAFEQKFRKIADNTSFRMPCRKCQGIHDEKSKDCNGDIHKAWIVSFDTIVMPGNGKVGGVVARLARE